MSGLIKLTCCRGIAVCQANVEMATRCNVIIFVVLSVLVHECSSELKTFKAPKLFIGKLYDRSERIPTGRLSHLSVINYSGGSSEIKAKVYLPPFCEYRLM